MGPGTVTNGGRHAVPGVHAVRPRLARRTAGRARRPSRRRPALGPPRSTREDAARGRTLGVPDLPAGRRAGGARALARVPRRRASTTTPSAVTGRTWPAPPALSASPEVRRGPPAHPAGRPGRGRAAGQGPTTFRDRAGLARVLRRRALAPTRRPPGRPAASGLRTMAYDDPADHPGRVEAWREGRTGFPFVDAGMRQLLAEGWMHNRVRMIVASFLVKDLHVGVAARRPALPALAARRRPGLATTTAGSGPRAPAPTRRRTSGSSTRSPRGCGSTRTATTCAATCPSWRHLAGAGRARAVEGGRRLRRTATRERIVDHAHEREVALERYAAAKD